MADLEALEDVDVPDGHHEKLTPLQRICVMRCFRPDRCYNAVKLYVMGAMGEKFVQPPVLDYGRIYNQSTERMPMVFILSPGADPQGDIQKLCDEKGMMQRFKFVALGQGQGPVAEQYLEQGAAKGYWVLLQNCHLLISWLKKLEKRLEQMKAPHKDSATTTEPSDRFPLGILQRSLKVVTEPLDGLKLNLRSTYSKIDTTIIDDAALGLPAACTCSPVHAVLQSGASTARSGGTSTTISTSRTSRSRASCSGCTSPRRSRTRTSSCRGARSSTSSATRCTAGA